MQQYNHSQSNIQIKFFLITEHISFLPTPIVNACQIMQMGRPLKEEYCNMAIQNAPTMMSQNESTGEKRPFLSRTADYKPKQDSFVPFNNPVISKIFDEIELDGIMNIKDTRYFPLIKTTEEIPNDIFNIICDNIIKEILSEKKINFTEFRDTLYDILTYNLDMVDCLWYILQYFIENGKLEQKDISDILDKSYTFLKYYNNNYRPIYHLESIMVYIINKIHKYDEL